MTTRADPPAGARRRHGDVLVISYPQPLCAEEFDRIDRSIPAGLRPVLILDGGAQATIAHRDRSRARRAGYMPRWAR